jgi:hypothetical protein
MPGPLLHCYTDPEKGSGIGALALSQPTTAVEGNDPVICFEWAELGAQS